MFLERHIKEKKSHPCGVDQECSERTWEAQNIKEKRTQIKNYFIQ